MKHLSLFTGILGFERAASQVWRDEHELVATVEIDPFCQAVIRKHYPKVPIHDDIRTFRYSGTINLLTGGFPCQPFSVAGRQNGKSDDRYLWPEMFRVIKEARPRWIVGENVAGIVKLALDDVLSDLEGEDYSTQAFIIPACAVNAPHRRDRVWIVAHSNSDREVGERRNRDSGNKKRNATTEIQERENVKPRSVLSSRKDARYPERGGLQGFSRRRTGEKPENGYLQSQEAVADSDDKRESQSEGTEQNKRGRFGNDGKTFTNAEGERLSGRGHEPKEHETTEKLRVEHENSLTADGNGEYSEEHERRDKLGQTGGERILGWRIYEPSWEEHWVEVATRLCGVDARFPNRVERIKSLGNAIVPQVAAEIFKAIKTIDEAHQI